MATPEYKAVDQLRTRLAQFQASINLLRHELESTQSMPSWSSLQTASSNVAATQQNLAQALASNQPLLSSAHAYPTPTFPGLTQEALLQQLLRKKMDPKAEDWLDRELDKQPRNLEDRRELWDWAGTAVKEMREELEEGYWVDFYTMEERKAGIKNVQTGIKRSLLAEDESDEDEEDDEEGAEDGDGDEKMGEDRAVDGGKDTETAARKHVPPPIPLETLLKYAVGAVTLPARAKG